MNKTINKLKINNELYDLCAEIVQVTYSELKELVDNAGLIVGKQYAITDYSCIYIQPVSNVEMEVAAPDVKYIICTAVSTNRLDEHVQYVRTDEYLKITECLYSIDPSYRNWTKNMTTLSPKGVVYYMRDEYDNEMSYDFKHVKFRRWAVTDITPCRIPNDGTNSPCSPFTVDCTVDCKSQGDDRCYIGSGEAEDSTLIEGAFSGKYAQLNAEWNAIFGSPSVDFSEDYEKAIKPFKKTNVTLDKYLAWSPNMNGSTGFPNLTTSTGVVFSHMATVATNSQDYMDVYTVSYKDSSGNIKDVTDLGNVYCGKLKINRMRVSKNLPNTVIMISDDATGWQLYDCDFGVNPSNNTVLLRPLVNNSYSTPYISNFSVRGACQYNLMSVYFLNYTDVEHLNANYLCGEFSKCSLGQYSRNVAFGYFMCCTYEEFDHNLILGVDYNYQLESGSVTSTDGTFSNNTQVRDWVGYNILGPLQYSKINNHFNKNTLRAPHNKGVTFESNMQMCSIGRCRWGVRFGYGVGQGLKFGNLDDVSFGPHCFQSNVQANANGVELPFLYMTDTTQYTIPNMQFVDVICDHGPVSKLYTDLSDEDFADMADSNYGACRAVLKCHITSDPVTDYNNVSKWVYQSRFKQGQPNIYAMYKTQAEYDAITDKQSDMLYVINRIQFSLMTGNGTYTTYYADPNQTIENWVTSSYNTDGWYISGSNIRYDITSSTYVLIELESTATYTDGQQYSGSYNNTSTCCFIAGTRVTLNTTGDTMNIEDIRPGQIVLSYDEETGEFVEQTVKATIVHHDCTEIALLTFEDGTTLDMTEDHPLYTKNGWRSLTKPEYDKLLLGDEVKSIAGWTKLIDINRYTPEIPVVTYTLSMGSSEKKQNYLSNNLVVHNAGCK